MKDVGEAAAIKIDVLWTDLAEPATNALKEVYCDKNMGVRISVSGDDTAAGISAVGMRLADIAAADRTLTLAELEDYPALEPYQIGNAVIVVISNPQQEFTKDDLRGLYNGTNSSMRAFHYEGETGIEERFCEYIHENRINETNNNVTGSFELMLESIKDTDGSVGFIPYGYVMSGDERYIAGIENDAGEIITAENITLEKITEAVRAENDTEAERLYPEELRPPIYYVTNGKPSTICDAFITWVRSPEGQAILRENGYVSLY